MEESVQNELAPKERRESVIDMKGNICHSHNVFPSKFTNP